MLEYWWAYPLIGGFVGLIAGMLGAGGGLLIVPLLVIIFEAKGFALQHTLHLAIGTCMASIPFTSIFSAWSHHRVGAVRWDIFQALLPGLIVGALAGAIFVGSIDVKVLTVLFIAYVYYASLRMLFVRKPKPTQSLPGRAGMTGMGVVIGGVSSLVAIAGAAISVPFMLRANVGMHQAVATSAAIGLPVSIAATVGYAMGGSDPNLPPYTLGYIYIPALIGVAIGTSLTAPVGARLSHKISANILRTGFALILLVLATRLAWRFLH